MKGGSKVKAILVIVILLLVGVLTVVGVGAVKTYMSGAAGGDTPTDVKAESNADCRGFSVTFNTPNKTQPFIMYGTAPANLLLIKASDIEATTHSMDISPVSPGKTFYYKIKIGEEVFDMGGIPYSVTVCDNPAASGDEAASEMPIQQQTEPVPTIPLTEAAAAPTIPASGSGECNKTTDYDGDGSITTVDYYRCIQGVPTPTTKVLDNCFNVDFNKDGVTNAIDRIQCLQSKGN